MAEVVELTPPLTEGVTGHTLLGDDRPIQWQSPGAWIAEQIHGAPWLRLVTERPAGVRWEIFVLAFLWVGAGIAAYTHGAGVPLLTDAPLLILPAVALGSACVAAGSLAFRDLALGTGARLHWTGRLSLLLTACLGGLDVSIVWLQPLSLVINIICTPMANLLAIANLRAHPRWPWFPLWLGIVQPLTLGYLFLLGLFGTG